MNTIFDDVHYSVVFAERRDVGPEWSRIVWDRNHLQVGCHRLYYLTSGSGTLELYGREVPLYPGRVYFVPAFSVQRSETEGMNKYYVHFQTASPLPELYRYFDDRYWVPATAATDTLFRTVTEAYTGNTPAAHMRVQGAMNLLMADFFEKFTSRADLSRFMPVLLYIGENYNRSITLAELASLMRISPMYFSNSFKRAFNVSPKQYILNKRLAESQRLLLETDLSIKEIAYAVGFENENYFSEFFSRKLGIGALRFRARSRLPRTHETL